EGANTRTEAYWDSIRPIPLSRDEAADYHQKDSIRLVRESRTYIDSMDRVSNYFRSKNLLLGYTYTRSAKNDAFTFYAPLELFHFNPIQGWAVGADLRYTRTKGRGREFNRFLVKTRVDYGFSEKQLRPTLQFQFRFDEISKSLLELELGKDLVEFNGQKSSKLFYESSNLFYKNNYIKYFDKEFVALTFGRNLHYDLRWRSELEFAIRRNAYIHSEFSFWNSSRPYQENQYADLLPDSLYIFNREVLRWTQALRWQPGTKVWKTPDELFSLGSSWPVFKLDYTAGVYLKKRQWFQRFSWSIEKYFDLEEWGEPRLLVEGDHLISKEKPDAPDWIFHNGNGLPFYVNTEGLGKFLTLYPFGFAGDQQSLAWHLEWDLKGRLLGRIPGVNRLGFNEIFRVSQLYVKEFRPYMEWSAGLGNVGYRFFRFLRVEWVNQFHSGGFRNAYLRVGLMSNILQGQ
ncbi:MAG TPA: DUF5686 family protein, partial [Saprospiraceae bacterium]|nr:DUF5686 family protein [Saprospiraceae bacterium]